MTNENEKVVRSIHVIVSAEKNAEKLKKIAEAIPSRETLSLWPEGARIFVRRITRILESE